VLGSLLGVRQKLLGEESVLFGCGAASPRPGYRAGHHAAALDAYQRLGGSADQREVPELQVRHVRRGVDSAQTPVEEKRVEVAYLGEEAL
jgi:uncharacterized Ntn-hydrolase superfamily protein